jgi:hypothetical protein
MIQDINTYKVKHPTIKEINIDEQFVTEGGKVVTFVGFEGYGSYKFSYNDGQNVRLIHLSSTLKFWYNERLDHRNIKERYIPLKDKLNQL